MWPSPGIGVEVEVKSGNTYWRIVIMVSRIVSMQMTGHALVVLTIVVDMAVSKRLLI